jgi:hypothetical protein
MYHLPEAVTGSKFIVTPEAVRGTKPIAVTPPTKAYKKRA